MQAEYPLKFGLVEQARYFAVPGAHLYTVLHRVMDPVARILLVGAFASERHSSYNAWVRWARYLSERRIEVLRYDYRGIGESTGIFEEMSFDSWSEDVQLLAGWIARQSPSVPLILHGLEMGAILAGRAFHKGTGDALLLWSPPANANQVLRSTLMRWAGLEQLYQPPEARRTAAQFIRSLGQGSAVEVQGYQWSGRLWQESFDIGLPTDLLEEGRSYGSFQKPVKVVRFEKDRDPLIRPHFGNEEVTDLSGLYAENFDWIAHTFASAMGGSHEGGD